MRLNITAGKYMNEHYAPLLKDPCIPFNEAFSLGHPVRPYFSAAFFAERAAALDTTEAEYRETMRPFLQFLQDPGRYDRLDLWFGTDDFCAANLAGLKEVLAQYRYPGKVVIHRVNEYSYEEYTQEEWQVGS